MPSVKHEVSDFIDGKWIASGAGEHLDVVNPATGEVLARVPLGTAAEVDQAAEAAGSAFPG